QPGAVQVRGDVPVPGDAADVTTSPTRQRGMETPSLARRAGDGDAAMPPDPPPRGPRIYKPEPGPEKLGDILGRLVTARGWGRRRGGLRLESAWAEAVGPEFAAHTRPGALRRGVLEVIVDSDPLRHELQNFHKRRLLTALRQRLADTTLTDLRFRAGAPE